MKKSILSVAVLFLFACLYGAHSEVKVYWQYRGDKRLIYEGFDMLNIGKKIRKGKTINVDKAAKACVAEGVYIIELNDGNTYSVQNDYWIYDEKNGVFIKISILNTLRELLIRFFLTEYTKNGNGKSF